VSTSAPLLENRALPRAELALRWGCLAACLLGVIPGVELLSWIWSRSEFLAHGYLMPALAAALLYMRRAELAEAVRSAPAPRSGPLWVLLAALFEGAAVVGEVSSAAGLGMPLMLGSVAYAVAGPRLLRVVTLPLVLLALAVPPPGFVLDPALLVLKGVVTKISVGFLQYCGYTVAALGNRILVPGHELFMANACSGLTSIVTLSPLAVVVAHFLSHGVWRRAVVIASVVPLAIATNIVRVTATIALVVHLGPAYGEGLMHEGFGVATFVVGTAGMIGVARWLR
jgi:exosortase